MSCKKILSGYNKSMGLFRFHKKKRNQKTYAAKRPIADVNGIYLGQDHFLRVVSQPQGRPEYVSNVSGVLTNFQLASRYGNIGLIAHNYLSGRFFSELNLGDTVYIMDGFGKRWPYRVTGFQRYQALNPRSPYSNFIDLETNQACSVNEVFKRVYAGSHHLVLQTCIKRGNLEEWGRLFVIAEPADDLQPTIENTTINREGR